MPVCSNTGRGWWTSQMDGGRVSAPVGPGTKAMRRSPGQRGTASYTPRCVSIGSDVCVALASDSTSWSHAGFDWRKLHPNQTPELVQTAALVPVTGQSGSRVAVTMNCTVSWVGWTSPVGLVLRPASSPLLATPTQEQTATRATRVQKIPVILPILRHRNLPQYYGNITGTSNPTCSSMTFNKFHKTWPAQHSTRVPGNIDTYLHDNSTGQVCSVIFTRSAALKHHRQQQHTNYFSYDSTTYIKIHDMPLKLSLQPGMQSWNDNTWINDIATKYISRRWCITWPHLCRWNGDETSSGSAIPGSYRFVRPRGNGIPLSDVYITNVLSAKPADCSSARNTPTPAQQTHWVTLYPAETKV